MRQRTWPCSAHLRLVHRLFIGCAIILACTAGEDAVKVRKQNVESAERHLVILLVPGLDFSDMSPWIADLPSITKSRLQVAGMSMRTAGPLTLRSNLFTLANGQLNDPSAVWRSELGERLPEERIFTLTLGRSDALTEITRAASLLIGDQSESAYEAEDHALLLKKSYLPGGWRTDWNAVTDRLHRVWQHHPQSLTIVELGDLWRIEQTYTGKRNTTQLKNLYRTLWLDEWQDWFAQQTAEIHGKKNVAMWIISPMISQEAKQRGELLAPFITWSSVQHGGILTSATTRQEGIVSNVDFLPTVLHFFNLSPEKKSYGQVIYPVDNGDRVKDYSFFTPFFEYVDYLFLIYGSRRAIITTYLLVMIFLLMLSAVYWLISQKQRGARIIQVLIGTMLISPMYLLWLTPLIKAVSVSVWLLILFSCSCLSSFLLYYLVRPPWFLIWIGLANTLVILVDVWRGSPWMKRSFLGYDPLIAARFYGLGNEYAGILLGSSLLAVTGICVYWARRGGLYRMNRAILMGMVSLFYLVIIYSMAAPNLGTNAGATLAALATYAFSFPILLRLRMSWSHLVFLFGGGTAFLICLIYFHLKGEQTHITLFVQALLEGDILWLKEIISRKLTMNWRLLKVSLWGKLFITALIVLGMVSLLLRHQPLEKKQRFKQQDVWMNGFKMIIVGAILILLMNDSGVVAAATTVIFVTFPFIFLHFDRYSMSSTPHN